MIAARLAWGNIGLHRRKSLLIGMIMGMGIFILFVGNSMIDTAVDGLRRMFVQGYTGDLMVTGPTEFPTTVLGETAGSEEVLPHIAQVMKYQEFLAGRKEVAGLLPLLSGQVAFGIGEQEIGQGYCFGANIAEYRSFFPDNITLVEGSWPDEHDGPWVLLSETMRDVLNASSPAPIVPGSKIIMTALANSAGTVIREVTVRGILKFNQSSRALAALSIADADTMRDLLGFASLRDGVPVLTGREAAFVSNFDPEALFENLFAGEAASSGGLGARSEEVPATMRASHGESNEAAVVPAWQFLLIRVKPGANRSALQAALSSYAQELGDGDRVQDWVAGAGKVARTAVTVRLVFDLLVAVVAVVVVMIMMNVLVISVNERLYEIGTLRAIGAKRRVVRQMILFETAFLALLAGAAGLAAGAVVLILLGKIGIRPPNLFFEALFGGSVLKPVMSAGAALRAFLWILAMGLGASFYPTMVALRIEPVVAMRGE